MADLDQAVLDNPAAQQEAANELRRQQFEQLRVERMRAGSAVARQARARALLAARRKIIPAQATSLSEELQAELSSVALQAYRGLWQQAHEVVEGLAFEFFLLGAIIAGPLAVALLGIRYFVGNVMNGGITIRRGGVELPLVPPMTIVEQTYRGAKVGFIALISGLEWAIIIIVCVIIADPSLAAKIGWESLTKSLTGTSPATTPVSPTP